LAHLRNMTKLQTLEIGDTKITNAGIKGLKKALPTLNVVR